MSIGINCPMDITIECNQSIDPEFTGRPGIVNPPSSYRITYVDNYDYNVICPIKYKIYRTWTVTDLNNPDNTASCTQTITVQNTMPPILIGCPPSEISVECNQVPNPANVSAIDPCGNPVNVGFSETKIPGSCLGNYQLIRIWTATDNCNNMSSECTQTITVVDTMAPEFIECPQDITIIFGDSTDPSNTGEPVVSDNCDPNPVVSYQNNIIPGSGPKDFTIKRTWIATDDCGNSSTCQQTITVVEKLPPPTIVCPPNVNLECNREKPPHTCPLKTGFPEVTDSSDPNPVITFKDEVIPGKCCFTKTIYRTWTATNSSDKSSSCIQTIKIIDTKPPTICIKDKIITSNCDISPKNTGFPYVVDCCDCHPKFTYVDTFKPLNRKKAIIVRKWIAIDCSNNESFKEQIITVIKEERDHCKCLISCVKKVQCKKCKISTKIIPVNKKRLRIERDKCSYYDVKIIKV